jgi:hydrogenase maturation protease
MAAKALRADRRLPEAVTVLETGIGGLHLVQELQLKYEAVILFDVVDRGGPPGELYVLEPQLPNLSPFSDQQRRDFFADTHYATPIRALTLAREIGALPPIVRIIGCQPADVESFGAPIRAAVANAIGAAVELALDTIAALRQKCA